jgi:hypothetical protein
VFVPDALVAAMPPSDASAPGSTEKNRPSRPSRFSSTVRRTPACTVASRSSTLTRTIRSIRLVSTETPPCAARMWPSSDEPVPNGITGTACAAQARTIAATSSVERGNATASGGAGANDDSSRPCRSSADGDVDSRSSSSARSAASAPSRSRLMRRSRPAPARLGSCGDRICARG